MADKKQAPANPTPVPDIHSDDRLDTDRILPDGFTYRDFHVQYCKDRTEIYDFDFDLKLMQIYGHAPAEHAQRCIDLYLRGIEHGTRIGRTQMQHEFQKLLGI